jgi:hypothetical protein
MNQTESSHATGPQAVQPPADAKRKARLSLVLWLGAAILLAAGLSLGVVLFKGAPAAAGWTALAGLALAAGCGIAGTVFDAKLSRVIWLWVIAFALMAASAVYQRATGPTHPLRGKAELDGKMYKYALLRSGTSGEEAKVLFPDPGMDCVGFVYYKRYNVDEDFTRVLMEPEGKLGRRVLAGRLPSEPPAGKLEYYISLHTPESTIRVPGNDSVVIRYKGAVPPYVLIPHIIFMFTGMLFGMRTLLEALAGLRGIRWMAWATFGLILTGGMILGPLVQKYAFGAAWTGVPFGWDLTDNKTLIMFVCWLVAVCFVGLRGKLQPSARWITAAAAALMIIIYLIPHSMHGSQLDYSKVEQGVPPSQAIGQD